MDKGARKVPTIGRLLLLMRDTIPFVCGDAGIETGSKQTINYKQISERT